MGKAEWANSYGHGSRPSREWEGHRRRSRTSQPSILSPRIVESPVVGSTIDNSALLPHLTPLVEQQQALIAAGVYDGFAHFGKGESEGQRMLEVFVESPFFDEVLAIAERSLGKFNDPRKRVSEDKFYIAVWGKAFEMMATARKIAQLAKDGKVGLPDAAVHELYKDYVFSGEEVLEFPMENYVMSRRGQPDIVVVNPDTMQVEGAIECTTVNDSSKYNRQRRLFEKAKDTGKMFTPDASFAVVTTFQDRRYNGEIPVEMLPVTYDQFKKFMGWMYDERKDESGRTLHEKYQDALIKAQRQETDARLSRLGVTIERSVVNTPVLMTEGLEVDPRNFPNLGFAS